MTSATIHERFVHARMHPPDGGSRVETDKARTVPGGMRVETRIERARVMAAYARRKRVTRVEMRNSDRDIDGDMVGA
jgi:hypothetical protein